MYVIAWIVIRLLRAGVRRPAPGDSGERLSPAFTGMAVVLQNRLSARLARGEITREQYRRAIEALAAADARRHTIPASAGRRWLRPAGRRGARPGTGAAGWGRRDRAPNRVT